MAPNDPVTAIFQSFFVMVRLYWTQIKFEWVQCWLLFFHLSYLEGARSLLETLLAYQRKQLFMRRRGMLGDFYLIWERHNGKHKVDNYITTHTTLNILSHFFSSRPIGPQPVLFLTQWDCLFLKSLFSCWYLLLPLSHLSPSLQWLERSTP